MFDKPFKPAKNPKHGYQRGHISMVYKFLWWKTSGSNIKNENIFNKELVEELHKPILRKLMKRKVQTPFIDNIWSTDLADMQWISNKGIKEFVFSYVLLSFIANLHGLFLWKIKKVLKLLTLFKKS